MTPPRPRAASRGLLVALLALAGLQGASAFGNAQKYLIVASPTTSRIAYLKLPESGAPASGSAGALRTLISSGLTFPQGVAVDEYRQMLYVADPALGRLVGYSLGHSGDALTVGSQRTIAEGVEVRAVAVDGVGNVFMTDEPNQRVLKVTAQQVRSRQTNASVVYESTLPQLRAPGGIATDNYFVYWLNKAETLTHTLVRASASPQMVTPTVVAGGPERAPQVLASNTPQRAYGLCLALGNVYYSDEFNLYGVPRAATARDEVVTVSTAMQEPRGCVFDGDGTVYVADKIGNAIYQFPANRLQPANLVRAADMEGAYGLALYTRVMS